MLKVYSVVLLNSSHRNKIKIGGFYSKKEAIEFMKEISIKHNKEIVEYAPKISEATTRKRR